MLTNLRLKNFQIWEELDIRLLPFTCIVGPSGYGKSSIVRALEAIFTAAAGTANIRHGADSFIIGLEVDDFRIEWKKSKKHNHYYLSQIELTESFQIYDKVGRKVPEEILAILDLPEAKVGDVLIPFYVAKQFDPPLLIFDSPNQAARMLMSVTGVDKLINIQKRVSSDRRKSSMKLKIIREQREALETDDALKRRIRACVSYQDMEPQIRGYLELQKSLETLYLLWENRVDKPRPQIDQVLHLSLYLQLKFQLDELPTPLDRPSELLALPDISLYEGIADRLRSLKRLKTDMRKCQISIGLVNAELEAVESYYHELIKGTCPFCGQEMPNE